MVSRGTVLAMSTLCVLVVLSWPHRGYPQTQPQVPAAPRLTEQLQARREAVGQEAEELRRAQEALETAGASKRQELESLSADTVTPALIEQARLDVETLRVRLDSLDVEQQEALQSFPRLESQVAELKKQVDAAESSEPEAEKRARQERLSQQQELLTLERQHLAHLQNARKVVEAQLAIARKWLQELRAYQAQALDASRSQALEEIKARIDQEHNALQQETNALREQLVAARAAEKSAAVQQVLEVRIQNLEEKQRLKQVELTIAHARGELSHVATVNADDTLSLDELRVVVGQSEDAIATLKATQALLTRKRALLEEQRAVAEKRAALQEARQPGDQAAERAFSQLVKLIQTQEEAVAGLMETANAQHAELQMRYAQQLQQGLLVRVPLPRNSEAWAQIRLDLADLPRQLASTVQRTFSAAGMTLTQNVTGVFFLILAPVFCSACWLLGRFLNTRVGRLKRGELTFTANVWLTLLRVLRGSLVGVAVICSVFLFLFFGGVPLTNMQGLAILALVWVVGKALHDLAWWVLAAPRRPADQPRHLDRYRGLRRGLIASGVLMFITVLVHYASVSATFRDLVDRVFFLFLTLSAIPALRYRQFLLRPFISLMSERRPLWVRLAQRLSLLWPLVILGGAVPGLIGYLNLAWTVALNTVLFVVALSVWLIACGVLQDGAQVLASYADDHSAYGRLWTRGIIRPLDKGLRFALLLVVMFFFVPFPVGFEGIGRTLVLVGGVLLGLTLVARICLLGLEYWAERYETVRDLYGTLRSLVIGVFVIAGLAIVARRLTVLLDEGAQGTVRVALEWVMTSGLRIVLIGALAYISLGVAHAVAGNVRKFMSRSSSSADTERRAQTLSGIARAVSTIFIVTLTIMFILREIGVEIGPLLATAGIGGLAIGFGAQNLVRDVISGFFILMEDQIRVGDVVKIGSEAGLVESVGLRIVTLRDLDGSVHIIPNGSIERVTNMTKEYSYYLLDMGVAYREDTDDVIKVMRSVAAEMRGDPAYSWDIMEDLEVMGVNDFADSAVIIRVRIKTRPTHQWRIGRELRRRVKKAFDAHGIEIPFPHQTVYMGMPKQGDPPPLHLAMATGDGVVIEGRRAEPTQDGERKQAAEWEERKP